MTNLTDKWKKGELPSGWYWVELKEGTFVDGKKSIILNYLFDFTNDFERHPYLVESVLEPVPSYEEYQKLLSDQLAKNEGAEINAELEAENTKLKELLKDCKALLSYLQIDDYDSNGLLVINKINQVLGEE